ncbi:cation-transporting ATPase 13A1 [Nematocida displodere]|uniref:Cation-transporting ATPase 13A1 n=1 Tax=Nematocida displodere TaxID=1805483 RepID=A0A177EIJ5_9MICR|nr:cation-transporting ATPase 13A1 [Nematocida displodere]
MNFELYRKRELWTHSYVIPAYAYPVIYGVFGHYSIGESQTSGAVIGMFFCALVQAFMFLSSFWGTAMYKAAKLQKAKCLASAEMVLVSRSRGEGRADQTGFATLKTTTTTVSGEKTLITWFEFDNDIYYFENGVPVKVGINLEVPFSAFLERSTLSRPEQKAFLFRDGKEKVLMPKNEFKIEPPTFLKMFAEHAVSPFFVFQIFCALLWMLDEYWKYSLFTFFTIISFEAGMVFQRLTNIRQLRSLNLAPQKIVRVVNEKPEETLSTELMPGDTVFIGENIQVPADLLILKGTAVTNESMLSGEATPVGKESIPDTKDVFSLSHHKKHVLYGGTKILKVGEKGVLCIVLRTGFMTEQGELIKSMVASEDTISENNLEAYLFILAMLVFAIASCIYVTRESVGLGKSVYKIVLECIMILTNVVPPELPMELTIAVNSSLQELVGLGVYCLEPFRIPFAGKITACCFDKTGTLTELNFQLENVEFGDEEKSRLVLGACHSAITLDGKVEGDPLDLCGIDFVAATLASDTEIVVDTKTYRVIRRFSFDSDLKRATVLVQAEDSYFVLMKGAPETVSTFLEKTPAFYNKFEAFAEKGYRVLTLAMKKLAHPPRGDVSRSSLEKNLEFSGFALYNSKLKKDAQETITHLAQSGHKVMMITGDNEKTAISVAKQLGMYNGHSLTGAGSIATFLKTVEQTDKNKRSEIIWPSVFARANPDSKERIIALLNASGEYTLMCGDGTNDVGALKAAHAGIALLEGTKTKGKAVTLPGNIGQSMFIIDEEIKLKLGDASVAAPFTSRTGSLQSVIDVISRGRSALVSTIQMYKVLALNSLLSAYTLSVFNSMGVRYGDFQMTAAGVLSALAFTFFGKSKPLPRISTEKPVAKIFSPYIVISVIFQTLVHIASFYTVYLGVVQHGAVKFQEKFEPTLANTTMFLLSTALQVTTLIVNYVGRPFRESLPENQKLLNSLLISAALVVLCTLETFPELNEKMELVSIPADMKKRLLGVMGIDLILCLLIEKFSFEVFMKRTSTSPKQTLTEKKNV